MCVAILQKTGASITAAQLFQGWNRNSDGAGFAYINRDKEVVIKQGYLNYNAFERDYRRTVEQFGNEGPMLVHMRIRTAGTVGPKNCHPFKIKGGALIHNGTMFFPNTDNNAKLKDRKSDTRIFAESFHNILDLASVRAAEQELLYAIGSHNKLCFLYDGGDYHIINEKAGYWDNDIWYSNTSCKLSSLHPSQR